MSRKHGRHFEEKNKRFEKRIKFSFTRKIDQKVNKRKGKKTMTGFSYERGIIHFTPRGRAKYGTEEWYNLHNDTSKTVWVARGHQDYWVRFNGQYDHSTAIIDSEMVSKVVFEDSRIIFTESPRTSSHRSPHQGYGYGYGYGFHDFSDDGYEDYTAQDDPIIQEFVV